MTNAVDRAPSYYAAANYLDGAAPNYATSAGREDAVYATNRIDFAQTLTLTSWNPTSNSTVYGGTLHGDAYRQFCNAIGYNNRILLFTDLAKWPGLVYHETGNMFLSFSPGEGEKATLPLVSLEKAARVGIVDANAELTVGRSFGRGVHTLNEKANATSPGRITLEDPTTARRPTSASARATSASPARRRRRPASSATRPSTSTPRPATRRSRRRRTRTSRMSNAGTTAAAARGIRPPTPRTRRRSRSSRRTRTAACASSTSARRSLTRMTR